MRSEQAAYGKLRDWPSIGLDQRPFGLGVFLQQFEAGHGIA